VSLLEVSVAARESGGVVVLAGEADLTSITQLSKVLDAQRAGRTTHLTIGVSKLRYADAASGRALAEAAVILRNRGGNLVLLHPQPSMVRLLRLLRADDMLTIQGDTETTPGP
jgi:anti-anti-sigma factor